MQTDDKKNKKEGKDEIEDSTKTTKSQDTEGKESNSTELLDLPEDDDYTARGELF